MRLSGGELDPRRPRLYHRSQPVLDFPSRPRSVVSAKSVSLACLANLKKTSIIELPTRPETHCLSGSRRLHEEGTCLHAHLPASGLFGALRGCLCDDSGFQIISNSHAF